MWRLSLWQTPVTITSVMAMLAMFVGPMVVAEITGRPLWQCRREWGSIESLTWVYGDSARMTVVDADLSGPFDLWDGDWWRVPVSTLHHVDGLHLMCNVAMVLMFGRLLESRWGSARTAVFVLGAMLVSNLPEYLDNRLAVGFSGVACAQFGALWAMRGWDDDVAERLPEDAVIGTLFGLSLLVVLTLLEVAPIANGAHAAGLAYGYTAAQLCGSPGWSSGWMRGVFILGHATLVWPYWAVTHPAWVGRYHWYQADRTGVNGRRSAIDWDGMRRAVAVDPTLSAVWRKLADQAIRDGNPFQAWQMLLEGLQANPGDQEQWRICRQVWRRLCVGPVRDAAHDAVQHRFGADSPMILKELQRIRTPPVLISPGRPIHPSPKYVATEAEPVVEWDPPPERVWPPRRTPPTMLPGSSDWAVEGIAL